MVSGVKLAITITLLPARILGKSLLDNGRQLCNVLAITRSFSVQLNNAFCKPVDATSGSKAKIRLQYSDQSDLLPDKIRQASDGGADILQKVRPTSSKSKDNKKTAQLGRLESGMAIVVIVILLCSTITIETQRQAVSWNCP